MINLRNALVAIAAVASFGAAQAVTIIDTGPGVPAANSTAEATLSSIAYRGVSFSLASAMNITSLEAWIGGTSAGNVLVELHSGTPTGFVVYSTTTSVAGASDWHGATGLNLAVAAGTYTLTVKGVGAFTGIMQGNPANPALAPANLEYRFNTLSNWREDTINNLAWRVTAIPAVPEPETYALALLGLALVGGAVRRQRKA